MVVDRSRRARAVRKRKRRMAGAVHDLTDTPLQRDCVLAISRGGRYTLDNIAPACGSCNASKCNEEVTGWLRRRRMDERAFLVRHLEIQRTLERQFGDAPA